MTLWRLHGVNAEIGQEVKESGESEKEDYLQTMAGDWLLQSRSKEVAAILLLLPC